MAKAPIPGTVKTRLVPPLTSEQATELYSALLLDQLEHLTALDNADLYLAFAPDGAAALVENLVPAAYQCFPQSAGDFGERMEKVLVELWRRGHRDVLLIGGDLPPVPLQSLHRAFAQLAAHPEHVVLGPSRDGGYYLVGMNSPVPAIFSAMSWSHERVLAETTRKLVGLGVDFTLLDEWFDVDAVADIARLRDVTDPAVRRAMKRTLDCVARLAL